jgi:hypothetical protein
MDSRSKVEVFEPIPKSIFWGLIDPLSGGKLGIHRRFVGQATKSALSAKED